MTAHEDWVTSTVKTWLETDTTARQARKSLVMDIRSVPADAQGRGPDDDDEDIEFLAGQLQAYTERTLVPYCGAAIIAEFTTDCISEADWLEIAAGYLNGEDGTSWPHNRAK